MAQKEGGHIPMLLSFCRGRERLGWMPVLEGRNENLMLFLHIVATQMETQSLSECVQSPPRSRQPEVVAVSRFACTGSVHQSPPSGWLEAQSYWYKADRQAEITSPGCPAMNTPSAAFPDSSRDGVEDQTYPHADPHREPILLHLPFAKDHQLCKKYKSQAQSRPAANALYVSSECSFLSLSSLAGYRAPPPVP